MVTESFTYGNSEAVCTSGYLWTAVIAELKHSLPAAVSVFDLGCGNGAFATRLTQLGYRVVGIDSSESGITIAQRANLALNLHVDSAYDPLAEQYGQFPCVISLEVIEHCYYPRRLARTVFDLIQNLAALLLLSTP